MIFITIILTFGVMAFVTTNNRYLSLASNILLFLLSLSINICLVYLTIGMGCNEDLLLFSLSIATMVTLIILNVYKAVIDCPYHEFHYVTKMIFMLNIVSLTVTTSVMIASYNTKYFTQLC